MKLSNINLFFGAEKLLIDEQIQKIKTEIIPDALESVNYIPLDGRKVLVDEIIDACINVPMMSDKKLVVVFNAHFFESSSAKENKADNKKNDMLYDFLEKVPSYTCLIFACNKVDKRKKLYKIIQKKGSVYEFKPPSLNVKAKWVQSRAKMYGKKIDLTTAYFIAQNTLDLYQTQNELEKVILFVGKKPNIEKKDIATTLSKSLESNIFDLIYYIGMKKFNEAINILNDLFYQGEKGIVILYMISKHIMELYSVKSKEGKSFQDIRSELGIHPFVLKKELEQSKNFSQDELQNILNLCQKLDLDIKKGKIDEKTGIELLITNMSITKT